MDERALFVLADRALQRVIDQVKDDQWDIEMSPNFLRSGQGKVTLREIVNYHTYDDAWVPDMLAGKTMDEAGKTKFDGDLLGVAPRESFGKIVDLACAAASELTDLERTVHCSFGDYPAREYFWQINSFRGLRAHDIARVIGVSTRLPDDLVQGLWDELSPHAEEWRELGVFPPRVEVPESAELQGRLLGLTGREP